jgi:hypothetical protein
VIPRIMDAAGISAYSLPSLISLVNARTAPGRWREYAAREWFESHEERCERALSQWAGAASRPGRVVDGPGEAASPTEFRDRLSARGIAGRERHALRRPERLSNPV